MWLLRRLTPVAFFLAARQLLAYAGVGFWMRFGAMALAAIGGLLAGAVIAVESVEAFTGGTKD